MAHWGGARKNAGARSKYVGLNGESIKTKQMRIPAILTREDLQKLALEKLKAEAEKS